MPYQCQFRPYQRPFRQPLQTSHGAWAVREGILLRLIDETGRIGWGEIAPLPWFGSETLEQALKFCRQLPAALTDDLISAVPDTLPSCQFAFESAWEGMQERAIGQATPQRDSDAETQAAVTLENSIVQAQNLALPPQNSVMAAQNSNTQAQNSVIAVQSSAFPPQNSVIAVQSSVIAVQNSVIAAQNSVIAAQNSERSPQSSAVGVQNSVIAAQSSALPPQNSVIAAQSLNTQAQNSVIAVQNSNSAVQSSALPPPSSDVAVQNPASLNESMNRPHPKPFSPGRRASNACSLAHWERARVRDTWQCINRLSNAQNLTLRPQDSVIAVQNLTHQPQSPVIAAHTQHPTPDTRHPTPPYSALLPAGEAALTAWKPLWEQGFRTFKWKIGVYAIAIELELLHRLTQALPQSAKLRLDANGGLSLDDATQWLKTCDAIAAAPGSSIVIEYLEQPLDVTQFQAMQHLGDRYTTPIALDESVATLQQLQACYENGWHGVFVIKPAIVGSPSRLRQFCQHHPIDAVFSSAFETAIGRQAGLRLAAAVGNPDRAVGYGTTHWFNETETNDFEQLWQTL